MHILVACEFSQKITRALRDEGHDAYSCDLEETEGDPAFHIQRDAIEVAHSRHWDGMIAHPPCTYLANSSARWFYDRRYPERESCRAAAIEFWLKLWQAPIHYKCFENPIPALFVLDYVGDYNQKIQPWQFGDLTKKATCLWLHNLPPLNPCVHVKPERLDNNMRDMGQRYGRQQDRSRTFNGIAHAMATQWWTDGGHTRHSEERVSRGIEGEANA